MMMMMTRVLFHRASAALRSELASRRSRSAAFLSRRVSTGDGEAVNFEIWDTAGQERFRSLNTPMCVANRGAARNTCRRTVLIGGRARGVFIRDRYYRGALGAIIVFDITDAKSFENARGWFSQVGSRARVFLVPRTAVFVPRARAPLPSSALLASLRRVCRPRRAPRPPSIARTARPPPPPPGRGPPWGGRGGGGGSVSIT